MIALERESPLHLDGVSLTGNSASHRFTSYAHPAGSGYDFVSALNLKNEWERELGLRVSGPEEHLYDAGSPESQERIKDGMDRLGVWIDTVSCA
jgi:N-acetylated-alpha-linked acidic dipeptidase